MTKTHFEKWLGILLFLLFKGASATVFNACLANNYKQHNICILKVLTSPYNLLIIGIKLGWLNSKQFIKAWGQTNSSKQPGNVSPKAVHLKRSPETHFHIQTLWQNLWKILLLGFFAQPVSDAELWILYSLSHWIWSRLEYLVCPLWPYRY